MPQFLEVIREEVRHQLAAQSGCTSATSSLLPTSLVPTRLDAAGTAETGMVLLLCTGACSCNVERTGWMACVLAALIAVHRCLLSYCARVLIVVVCTGACCRSVHGCLFSCCARVHAFAPRVGE